MFRIYAFSRPACGRNPMVRIGFRLFGRRQQLKFARHTADRMARLTEEKTGRTPAAEDEHEAAPTTRYCERRSPEARGPGEGFLRFYPERCGDGGGSWVDSARTRDVAQLGPTAVSPARIW